MKIKRIKPKLKYRKAQVQAMKKLLKYYEGKIDVLDDCPLCDSLPGNIVGCSECVWTKETGGTCMDRAYEYGTHTCSHLRRARQPDWTQRRIKELKKWIEKYDV